MDPGGSDPPYYYLDHSESLSGGLPLSDCPRHPDSAQGSSEPSKPPSVVLLFGLPTLFPRELHDMYPYGSKSLFDGLPEPPPPPFSAVALFNALPPPRSPTSFGAPSIFDPSALPLFPTAHGAPPGYALLPSIPWPIPQKPFPFLDLPAELKNKIYREVLVSSRTFTISPHSQRFPCDTGLLCVSKQVHSEASSIFYEENVFWFPQALFDGQPILGLLDNLFALPSTRLMTLKNFVIDITVRVFPSAVMPAIPRRLAFTLVANALVLIP